MWSGAADNRYHHIPERPVTFAAGPRAAHSRVCGGAAGRTLICAAGAVDPFGTHRQKARQAGDVQAVLQIHYVFFQRGSKAKKTVELDKSFKYQTVLFAKG